VKLATTGAIAGVLFGYVLQRSDLCFHSAWRGVFERRYHLTKIWLLGVAVATVGLSLVYASDRWRLNEGLALRPQGNVGGELVLGIGMVVAASCASGLFYKLGSGMLGAIVGLGGWFAGDVAGSELLTGRDGSWDLRGSVALRERGPTVADVLDVDRLAVSVIVLVVVAALLARTRRHTQTRGQWGWALAGLALGAATTAGWMLAGAGRETFGPSTTGAAASLAEGDGVDVWLVAFLAAITVGALVAAARTRTLWPRGEATRRYAGRSRWCRRRPVGSRGTARRGLQPAPRDVGRRPSQPQLMARGRLRSRRHRHRPRHPTAASCDERGRCPCRAGVQGVPRVS
jgi:hypothetical protein